MKKIILFCSIFSCMLLSVSMAKGQLLVSTLQLPGSIDISQASILVDTNDALLVQRAAVLLQQDIAAITDKNIAINHVITKVSKTVIIVGSIEHSTFMQQLILQKKINITAIKNKWEAFQIQAVANPIKGVDNALLIMGSDRRGAAFGVFELSKSIGISPWYWWADVPIVKQKNLFVQSKVTISDAPKVKYRGIFINDEAPALSNWSKEKFGGFNHQFYAKVFELMLRLKANYIWPAMWGNAFYDDDSLNIKTADEFGIVIGTSHHEPLMRAHDEWRRYGKKQKWNYDSTENGLKAFWKQGMLRATNEKIVSVGMRGDGDEPMSRETATSLLERIVTDQREIIEETTNKPASETPQLWALYKEVQDYYDKGMRVPDDITLLLCDDNWGNIRKLPSLNEKSRKGGYGIYYHFDYVGGPRNYKWLNTNPIPRVWEQMHMAWEYNARQIWIVNVGDIKPMEFPISFFLDYALNPEKIDASDLQKYTEQWCASQFGKQYPNDIAKIISAYSKYNGRKKPELLDENTYNIESGEAAKVTNEYNALLARAEKINNKLLPQYRDAFFQLVLHPVKACANLQNLYTAVAYNRLWAKENSIKANKYADSAKLYYATDSLITLQYHAMANGKWNHMIDQTHIGYTYWQQPNVNKMPTVKYIMPDSAVEEKVIISKKNESSKNSIPANAKGNIFYEENNFIAIEADHFTRASNSSEIKWKILHDHGRTGNAITTFPVTSASLTIASNSPFVEYAFYSYSKDDFKIDAYFSPTLNFANTVNGLQYAITIDDEIPQVVSINKDDKNVRVWESWMKNNIILKTTNHTIQNTGLHKIKYWYVNAGVVLQKLVLDFGGLQKSYLGPVETRLKK